jgi:tRNA(Met) cytidine acetyltransferase
LLLLLTPPLAVWPRFNDPEHARIVTAPYRVTEVTGRFLQRFVKILGEAPGIVVVEQGKPLPSFVPESAGSPVEALGPASEDFGCRTDDQRRAVVALIKVMTGQRWRPVVLTSDRGRGKSAALGIAAAYLLQQGAKRILVTGPRLDAVTPVFAHAQRLLPQARASRARLQFRGRGIWNSFLLMN